MVVLGRTILKRDAVKNNTKRIRVQNKNVDTTIKVHCRLSNGMDIEEVYENISRNKL